MPYLLSGMECELIIGDSEAAPEIKVMEEGLPDGSTEGIESKISSAHEEEEGSEEEITESAVPYDAMHIRDIDSSRGRGDFDEGLSNDYATIEVTIQHNTNFDISRLVCKDGACTVQKPSEKNRDRDNRDKSRGKKMQKYKKDRRSNHSGEAGTKERRERRTMDNANSKFVYKP